MKKSVPTGRDTENPKITRKPDPKPPAPHSIEREIKKEADRRKNGSN